MPFFERLINLVALEIDPPKNFGGFHLLCIALVLCISVLPCVFLKDAEDNRFRLIMGISFLVMLMFEVFKQIFVSLQITDGQLVFSYVWSHFPFQLCSTPLYVLPFLALLPDNRVRDVFASYTMTFALLGGIAVYLVPNSVFGSIAVWNVQSMVHHGIQIVTGVYTASYYRRRINLRFFLLGVPLFALFFAVANLLNTVGCDFLVSGGLMESGAAFNMFYISPRPEQTMPMFEDLLASVPPLVMIIGYFAAVFIGALILAFISRALFKLSRKNFR